VEPEWVGVYIATYCCILSTLAFSASINETCGRQVPVATDTIWVELKSDDAMFELRRGECKIFTGENL
jgi:hypothetical protein